MKENFNANEIDNNTRNKIRSKIRNEIKKNEIRKSDIKNNNVNEIRNCIKNDICSNSQKNINKDIIEYMRINLGKILKIQDKMLNAIFPKTCPVCDNVIGHDQTICMGCINKIHYISEPRCKKCGKSLKDREAEYCIDCEKNHHLYKCGIAAFLYDDVISKSIYRFKYHNRRTYAEFYGGAIVKTYGELIRSWHADVIIPVPIHEKKLIKRGYNQAGLIAKELGKNLGMNVDERVLLRTVNTRPQKEMTKAERKKNLEKAFKISRNVVEYKKVILVDDIYTTGSTVDECTKALLGAGIQVVYFVSLSIGASI